MADLNSRGRMGRRLFNLSWQMAVPSAFLLIMFLFFPFREKIEYDKDEGVNLMKAMLVVKGYSLYDQIWSDQPPLFTQLLASLFRFTGFKVNAARLLVLILSTILLWAGFEFLRRVWGNAHALAGVILIILLPAFLELSASVMVGLPAITFAMLSLLALTLWHLQRKDVWLILSAIVLGCSILTKAFTGFLAPIFIVGILFAEYSRLRGRVTLWGLLRPAIVWGVVFAGFSLVFGLILVGPRNVMQLVTPHLAAEGTESFQEERYTIAWHLQAARPILFLALAGGLFTILEKRWLSLYPLAWMVTAYGLLSLHAPVWYHQQLLVTIPAAILAAIGGGEALRSIIQIIRSRKLFRARTLLALAAIAGFGFILATRAPATFSQFNHYPTFFRTELRAPALKLKFLKDMNEYAPQTHWIVTDMPMYAFRAGLPVPANLATFTTKRWKTGNLAEEEIFTTVQTLQPEEILFGRFEFPSLEPYLEQNYRLLRDRNEMRLYIRNDLVANP